MWRKVVVGGLIGALAILTGLAAIQSAGSNDVAAIDLADDDNEARRSESEDQSEPEDVDDDGDGDETNGDDGTNGGNNTGADTTGGWDTGTGGGATT